ncbi:MAG: FKBP-type peptidyl-prolyl cis-trans isomerase [Muribaculaceae bacterium]|nr:FKBP-type peptidyl-prolyl cis-trans isomerase [Muribaculaceae bacterium]
MTLSIVKTRLLLPLMASVTMALTIVGCNDDESTNNWDDYKEWREANEAFFSEQQFRIEDGKSYYQTLTPAWNTGAQILVRYLKDRSKTEGNYSPLLNSTVDVKYIGRLYNGEPFDSSFTNTTYGDSIFRTRVNGVISGWTIALQEMRVGDSIQVVIPYSLGYGAQSAGIIKPYSTLVFDIKLVDIPYYEVRP